MEKSVDAASNESNDAIAFGSFSDNQLLNYQQASKYLGISEPYLKKLKNRNNVPFVEIGKSVRFRIASLNRWIQQREVS